MRNHFECALFCPPELAAQFQNLQGTHAKGRLVIHCIADRLPSPDGLAIDALSRLSLVLQRYDVCLVPVDVAHLSWFRSAMLAAKDALVTPVVCVSVDLAAGALHDLYNVELAEFIRAPLCLDELRVRVAQMLEYRSRMPRVPALAVHEPVESVAARKPFTRARVSPLAVKTSRPVRGVNVCDDLGDQCGPYIDAFAAMVVASENSQLRSYKNSKQQFWTRYTCSYIHEQLRLCRGNVTRAASRAGKNRRAFSALMRLYGIDPAPYRLECHDSDSEG